MFATRVAARFIHSVLAAEKQSGQPLTLGEALAEFLADITEAAPPSGRSCSGRERTTVADGDGSMMADRGQEPAAATAASCLGLF